MRLRIPMRVQGGPIQRSQTRLEMAAEYRFAVDHMYARVARQFGQPLIGQ